MAKNPVRQARAQFNKKQKQKSQPKSTRNEPRLEGGGIMKHSHWFFFNVKGGEHYEI